MPHKDCDCERCQEYSEMVLSAVMDGLTSPESELDQQILMRETEQ